MWRRALVVMLAALTIEACSASPGVASGPAEPATARPAQPALGMPDVPVDPTLKAVSRTNPPADAKEALNLCVREGELDNVVGMAQLPARDVHRFSLTNGKEPELQTDTLVWAIQFKGTFFSRGGADVIDPLCVVIDLTAAHGGYVAGTSSIGTAIHYVPYGRVGETFTPPKDFVPAVAALPPLAP